MEAYTIHPTVWELCEFCEKKSLPEFFPSFFPAIFCISCNTEEKNGYVHQNWTSAPAYYMLTKKTGTGTHLMLSLIPIPAQQTDLYLEEQDQQINRAQTLEVLYASHFKSTQKLSSLLYSCEDTRIRTGRCFPDFFANTEKASAHDDD